MKLKYILLLALIFRLLMSPFASHIDVFNHLDWGEKFFSYTPKVFYSPDANVWDFTWPNQPPGAIYIFAASFLIYKLLFSVLWFFNSSFSFFPSLLVTFSEKYLYIILVKLPAILSDIGIAILIYKMLPKKYAKLGAILFLLNPVSWYNSAVWGQTDATINFFILFSFYLLFKKKLNLSVLAFAISLYIKLSLVIFAPIYFIYFYKKYSLKNLIKPILVTLVFLILTTLPFLNKYTPDPVSFLQYVYLKKVLVDQMQVITANAFNFWGALKGLELQSHDQMFFVFSYKAWGYILASLAILPALFRIYKRPTLENTIWSLAIISFSVFMLFTNMHERYIYPLFPYLTILVAQNRKLLIIYISISLITLLNMYNLWWVPEISFLNLILENILILRLLSFVNLGLFIYFYYFWLKKKTLQLGKEYLII